MSEIRGVAEACGLWLLHRGGQVGDSSVHTVSTPSPEGFRNAVPIPRAPWSWFAATMGRGDDVSTRGLAEASVRLLAAVARTLHWRGGVDDPMLLAGALISDGHGRLLLLHRNTPGTVWWEVPGGKVEPGESVAEAACRELAEELDARVEVVHELGTGDFDHDGRRLRYTWYLAHVVEGEPSVVETDRFDRLSYFTVGEAAALQDPSPSLRRLFELHGNALQELSACVAHVAPNGGLRERPA